METGRGNRNEDNWMIVGKTLSFVCKRPKKKGDERRGRTAKQTLFDCMLETGGSDKLS